MADCNEHTPRLWEKSTKQWKSYANILKRTYFCVVHYAGLSHTKSFVRNSIPNPHGPIYSSTGENPIVFVLWSTRRKIGVFPPLISTPITTPLPTVFAITIRWRLITP